MHNKTFSSLLLINECLLDRERTNALRAAIHARVRPGDIVVDAGTGTGILALFAAEAGAKKVYAVDLDPEALELARSSVRASPYADTIEVVQSDVHTFTTERPVDVLIMEMLDTGLVAEQQGPALNALHRNNVIGPCTKLIPQRVRCAIEFVEFDFSFWGFSMPLTIQARNDGSAQRVERVLSDTAVYRDVDLSREFALQVDATVVARMLRAGLCNALRLRTQTVLLDDLALWETSDMNMPVIIPVAPGIRVREGDSMRVALSYQMGRGYTELRAESSACR